MPHRALLCTLLLSTASFAQSRFAESPRRQPEFGDAGQVVPLGSVSLSRTTASGVDTAVNVFSVQPTLLWFVADHVLLGVDFSLQTTYVTGNGGGPAQTNWGAGGRLGFALNLSSDVSFMPMLLVEYQRIDLGSTGTRESVGLGVDAPLLFFPARHFFLGLGPRVLSDVSASDPAGGMKLTTIALDTVIGGWF